MYDNINPPTFHVLPAERCEKCSEMHYERELYVVYTSIEDYEEWCDRCIDNHAKEHPIMKDEFWAIGSTDTENNLTIK